MPLAYEDLHNVLQALVEGEELDLARTVEQ